MNGDRTIFIVIIRKNVNFFLIKLTLKKTLKKFATLKI
jgi:hypothetical protein